jgi:hypothetical protein
MNTYQCTYGGLYELIFKHEYKSFITILRNTCYTVMDNRRTPRIMLFSDI